MPEIAENIATTCTIIDLPPDIAAALDAGPDARALLTVYEGRLSSEILSTPRLYPFQLESVPLSSEFKL